LIASPAFALGSVVGDVIDSLNQRSVIDELPQNKNPR